MTEPRASRFAWGLVRIGSAIVVASSSALAEEPAPETPPEAEPVAEVVVTGTKVSRLAGAAHVIGEKQLERREHDDPHAVLASVPGTFARGEDGIGLRPNIGIRGVATDRSKKVTLMEDGVLLGPAPYSAPAAYYFPLVTRMVGVRVIKGPAATAYGPQTIGGAIDFATRRVPGSATGRIDAAGGQYGYAKLHAYAGSSDERMGYVVEGVHLRSSGFKELDGGGDTGFWRNEWMAKLSWVPDPTAREHNELTLKLGYSNEESNETYLGLTDADFRSNPLRRYAASQLDQMRWHRTQIALTHDWRPAPNVRLETTAYRHDLSRIWRKFNGLRGADVSDVLAAPGSGTNAVFYSVLSGAVDSSSAGEEILVGPNDRTYVSQGVQTVVRWNVPGKVVAQRIEHGLRLHHDSIDRRHTQNAFAMQSGRLVDTGAPTEVTTDNRASTHALSMYVADAIQLGRLTVTPGARVEVIQTSTEDRSTGQKGGSAYQVVLPGAAAAYEVIDDLALLGGVHRGFSPTAPAQAESIEPELSVNYEAGARFSRRKLRADLVGFYHDYSNLTDICTFSNGCLGTDLDRQFPAGAARVYGLEASFDHELPVAEGLFVPMSAAYTFTRGEFLRSFQSSDPQFGDVTAGDELPYLPNHQLALMTGLGSEQWEATASGTYVSSMKEQGGTGGPLSGVRTDAHFVLDLGGHYRVTKWLDVYLNAKNVLNEEYIASRRPFGARPGAPRWVQAGVRAGF